jgi:hypothetical protein
MKGASMADIKAAEVFVGGVRKVVQILRYGPREVALAVLGFLLLGTTALVPKLTELLPFTAPAQPWISRVLAVVGALFLGLSSWRVWRKAVAPLPEAKPKSAAIKGPAPFGPQDAELFARLGRNHDLDRLRDWILDDQKPLFALMGESGIGKTSLLRAGLAHHLKDDGVPVLYWEALPRSSKAGLLRAVQSGWQDAEAPKSFEGLATAVAARRCVVVIDQAEQLSPEGHPEIFELLSKVATMNPPYRATWVVAFRREYLPVWRDFELNLPEPAQSRLETMSLRRFTPETAERVLAVLAEEGGVTVEQKVVQAVIAGVTIEGRVSPADIGISLLVLSELSGEETLAYSLTHFRESGGQEGLLTRYLERLLEQFVEAERQEVLQALLALIDLERDQRLADGRLREELVQLVRPASAIRFAAALRFLASGKARILEELPGSSPSYRLSHERLIPALRRLTGVLLEQAKQADLLLERSYRVWERDRRARFLLSGQDLRQVLRFREQLFWGVEAEAKRRYLQQSRRRRNWLWCSSIAALVVLPLSVRLYSDQQVRAVSSRNLLESWGLPPDLYDRLGQLEELALEADVTRLDWLERARKLKVLRVDSKKLSRLEGVPSTVEVLALENVQLPSLEGLPKGLQALRLRDTEIASYKEFPPKLISLEVGPSYKSDESLRRRYIEGLGDLPDTLEVLSLKGVGLRRLEIPPRLKSLSLLQVDVDELVPSLETLTLQEGHGNPRFPPGLRSLSLAGFSPPGGLPSGLESLALDCRYFGEIPALPEGLESLTLRGCDHPIPARLVSLAVESRDGQIDYGILSPFVRKLPASLQFLSVLGGRIDLRQIPPGMRTLHMILRDQDIAALPQNLEELRLNKSWPIGFRSLPRKLRSFSFEGGEEEERWKVQDLGDLPANLASLTLKRVSIKDLRGLPRGLTSLVLEHCSVESFRGEDLPRSIRHLDFSNTQIPTLEGLPEDLQSLDLSSSIFSAKGWDFRELPRRLRALTLNPSETQSLDALPRSVAVLRFERGLASDATWPLDDGLLDAEP